MKSHNGAGGAARTLPKAVRMVGFAPWYLVVEGSMSSRVMTCWALVWFPQASVTVQVRVMTFSLMQLDASIAVPANCPPSIIERLLPDEHRGIKFEDANQQISELFVGSKSQLENSI